MQVYDQVNKINVFGDIHVDDLTSFFAAHQVVTDAYGEWPDSCTCDKEVSHEDWAIHAREEFIEWIKRL